MAGTRPGRRHHSPARGLYGLRRENSSIRCRLSSSTPLGTTILSTTNRSPAGLPPEAGTPWPLSRSFSPLELPAGMVSDFRPSGVGTSILAPRIASPTVIGTSTRRSRPSRRKYGCGSTVMTIVRSPAGRPLGAGLAPALEPQLGAGLDARRDLHDQALGLARRRAGPRSWSRRRGRRSGTGWSGGLPSPGRPAAGPTGRRASGRAGPRRCPAPPAPPRHLRAPPPTHVAEELGEVDVLEARLAEPEREIRRRRSAARRRPSPRTRRRRSGRNAPASPASDRMS